MKNNGPVTQKEVPFPSGQYLVSKTDLKGIITYCNDAFIDISGFGRDELLGKSHNIVRHPDMPAAAFDDLWKTVKSGRPWRGIVKNRCMNGDHYWVDAFVVPLRRNGQAIGYMSVRSAPSREQVRQAEGLYQQINAGRAGLPKAGSGFLGNLSMRLRIQGVMGLMALLLVLIASLGMVALSRSNEAIKEAYENHMKPSIAIAKMIERLGDNRSQIMLALQHSPDNKFHTMHDHPVALHIDNAIKNREVIESLRKAYEESPKSAEEAEKAKLFFSARDLLSKEGNSAARDALKAGDYDTAQQLLLTKINPLYAQVLMHGENLQKHLSEDGQKAYAQAEASYASVRNMAIFSMVGAILLVIFAGGYLVSVVVTPIRKAIDHFDHISEGILTDEIDTAGRDEAGQLMCSLASMQVQLKVILDEVRHVSVTLDDESRKLSLDMDHVVQQSTQQQDRVQGTAAATEELTQSVAEVASSVDSTAQAASKSKLLVAESTRSMSESMDATSRVIGAVQNSSATIADLNRAIEKIGVITNTIREIAEQTNLLALNAAIEAARAGEQGRGFAVVADEVRKLAERTSSSTADINTTVNDFQSVTLKAVTSMEQATREVEAGISLMRSSVSGLDQIRVSSDEVASMADTIASASREQAIASQDVAVNMEQVSSLIEQNTSSATSALRSAESLSSTAAELRNVVAQFKLIK
jgi:aerotaxis receptor